MDKGRRQSQRKRKREIAEIKSTEGQCTPLLVSPTSTKANQYDVFLSFRGPDTRKGFTSHLYEKLSSTVQVYVFRDDDSIPIGKEINSLLLDAIKRSKIAIPIISKNFASSKWCLQELVQIMKCHKTMSLVVLPIFYKVAPSDVRHLEGKFGEAFKSCRESFNEEDIKKVRRALKRICRLKGLESRKIGNGHEAELIKHVVKAVQSVLGQDFQLDVPEHLIGLEGHLKRIMSWIDNPSDNARMIGIYGMGGIGKTTLVKYIYNQLYDKFDGASFLGDIQEKARHSGIEHLQSLLISDILPYQDQTSRADSRLNIIKSKFKRIKVLIILDDVDHKDQLHALARKSDWFMEGSVIITTTRYKAILDRSEFKVKLKYELTQMDEMHSLRLFNRHAFDKDHSPNGFKNISRDIVSTLGGLPLALEIIGSHLYGRSDLNLWKESWKQLKEKPHEDVQEKLKISYDVLKEGQKHIFLDIACLFIGENSKYAMHMWDDCGFYPIEGLDELKLRCLINIEKDGTLRMHDQLRDLGRCIIRDGQQPMRGSRLWDYEEASKALKEGKGTKRIQALSLSKNQRYDLREFTNEQFMNLSKLRFLQLWGVNLSGEFDISFPELRWLRIRSHGDLTSLSAINFNLPKLVVLQFHYDEYYTKQPDDWDGWSSILSAKRLKVLDLSHMAFGSTPDFSAFPELEILILKGCKQLKQLHPSVGTLKCLVSLDLSGCRELEELPEEMGGLKGLKELILYYSGIKKFPTSIGFLRKLEILDATACRSLREIPSSIGRLSSLQQLNLNFCWSLMEIPDSIGELRNLQLLEIWCEGIKEFLVGRLKKLQRLRLYVNEGTKSLLEIGELSSLQHLDLDGVVNIGSETGLPSRLSQLIHLEELRLSRYELLEHLRELPSTLQRLSLFRCLKVELLELDRFRHLVVLSIKQCHSIERCDLSLLYRLKRLNLDECDNLLEIQGLDDLESLEEIIIDCCRSIRTLNLPKFLKIFTAEYCKKLLEIQGLDKAEFLEKLYIPGCKLIKRLPDLSCFATLKELDIRGCCHLLDVEVLERFLYCRKIFISGCESLEKLPNLSKLEYLKTFTITDSHRVIEIPGIEESRSLTEITIARCPSLETLPDLSGCENLQKLIVAECEKLTRIQGLIRLHLTLEIYECYSLELPELPQTGIKRLNEKYDNEFAYHNDKIVLR